MYSFLEKFKLLEARLRKIAHSTDKDNFYTILSKVEKINYLVKKKRDILLDLNALRNVLAHSDREKYIAEIKKEAYLEIDNIVNLLDNPPSIGIFFNKRVYSVDTDEILEIVIKNMQKNIYTHVPVYKDNKFYGVFSETSIFSWLVDCIQSGRADFYKPQMKSVKREYLFCETNKIEFVAENTSIFTIPERFNNAITKKTRLGALIITKTGDKDESPIGIITAWDLPLIDSYINRYV